MDSEIIVESLPIVGVCSLCEFEGVVESMLLKTSNKILSYMEMLLKCFSIDMTILDLDDTKLLICSVCINKLEDCLKFKEQVEITLKGLDATARLKKADQHGLPRVKEEFVKDEDCMTIITDGEMDHDDIESDEILQNVKKELVHMGMTREEKKELKESDTDDEMLNVKQESLDINELDVLNELVLKSQSKHYRTRQSKITTKRKITITVKNVVDLNETEKMLESGLFPFKICKNHVFSCTICPEKFPNLDDMKTHIKDHSITNIHRAFKKMITSNLHWFYKSSTNLKCKSCEVDVSDFNGLKEHIDTCARLKNTSSKLPFKLEKDQLDCPICQKSFLHFVSLNTHMNVHYPNYVCSICGKAFASKARLRGHMRTHEVGDFPCRYCDAVFDKITKRENHVSKEHKSGARYTCRRCNISLTSFYARQKHLAEVHNEELKRYKCKACPQSYITPGHLSSHVRRDHLNERNHKCNKCDLAFYTRNSLRTHMIKHDGARIHACNICMKSYQRKKTLREHMRIHDNDKRFVCPVCGRAFTQKCTLKGHLKVHERKMDLDERVPQPLHSI